MRPAHLLFVFLTCFSFSGAAMNGTTEQAVDELMQKFAAPAPGAAIMVIQNGKPILAKTYGLAELDSKLPCTTNTNFRLASVSKQFTAMSILMLAERGKLSLDDRITKFFPELPAYAKEITIRHLLTHTGGLIDYEDVLPPGTTIPLSDRDVLVLLLQQDKTYFPPGSEFRYSNSGYCLLALLVEQASGQKFSTFVKENIFTPLGMTNSVAYERGVSVIPHRAYGYSKKDDGFHQTDQSLTSGTLGDGGIYSSVEDLFKWDQALYTQKLVSTKTLADAFTVHSPKSDFKGSGYGYGWYIDERRKTKHIWHYGSTCGFSTRIDRFPDKNLSLILLTNRRDADLGNTVTKLLDLYLK